MDETYGVHICWLSTLTCLNLPDSGRRRQLPFYVIVKRGKNEAKKVTIVIVIIIAIS